MTKPVSALSLWKLALMVLVDTAGVVIAAPCVGALAAEEPKPVPAFSPVLVEVRLVAQSVRPGGRLGVTYVWRNDGAPPDMDYMVFAHFEHPERDCRQIVFQQDHFPLIPTSAWEKGQVIEDGPYSIPVPPDAAEGSYWVHVGLWEPPGGDRICEKYWGQITIDASAPMPDKLKPLSGPEPPRPTAHFDARLTSAQTIESDDIAFTVSADNGSHRLLDKRSGVAWHSSPLIEGLGDVELRLASGRTKLAHLGRPQRLRREGQKIALEYEVAEAGPRWRIIITARILPDPRSLELSWAAAGEGAEVVNITLLSDALWTADRQGGYVIVPSHLGLMLPADSGEAYLERYEMYRWGGCQMEMLGVVSSGSAALVSWRDDYALASVKSVVGEKSVAPAHQVLAPSLRIQTPGSAVRITLLGEGGYVEIARAYRDIARENGWLVSWEEKTRRWPNLELDKLLGAPDIKPFVLSRTLKSSRYYGGPPNADEDVSLGYTFDEAAQIAEHLRRDLGIEKALFVLAGWIHRGYDNQHPDLLPAAPECGGNAALADASARIRRLGYLFGLHDNYQDMYQDAPSWSERAIIKQRDGSLMAGGNWAGGQAWLVCSKEGLQFAARPQQNLPRVKELFDPNAYFIDTTFASELLQCFDPAHPETRWDDMKYKSALSDFSASLFGVHGSEEGMEWAVPHAAYFEGLLTAWADPPYGRRIPLFELVYHDCIAIYPHQGDRAGPNQPDYIVRLISLGRMPLYAFGSHLYWREERGEPLRASASVERLAQTGPRRFDITYRWSVEEDIAADWRVFVHFTKHNGDVVFQGDHEPQPPVHTWKAGQQIVVGPLAVEAPEGVEGTFDIRIGLFKPESGERALLADADDGMRRYTIGRVRVSGRGQNAQIALERQEASPLDVLCLARSDGGWGQNLCLTDKFIKNTYEVMSPLNELTAKLPMTDYQFLTPDGLVRRTVFGGDVEVIVNLGRDNYRAVGASGETLLPPYGFSVRAPQFQAFHALSWRGIEYRRPALFAIRSLDGRSIEQSQKLRIFHGFGDPRVKIGAKQYVVDTERIVGGKD